MTAATSKSNSGSKKKLLALSSKDGNVESRHLVISDLPQILRSGDVLVINDAATLPASLFGIHLRIGEPIEMRLAGLRSPDWSDPSKWAAIFFGSGDWRTPTEHRSSSPLLLVNDRIDFGLGLVAQVEKLLIPSTRFAEIAFLGDADQLWHRLYQIGRPIQYSHLKEDLNLWDIQTLFSGPPVSLEPPSALFPFNWDIIFELEKNGVEILSLTHAAGLSSTGDTDLDRKLPFPERYRIPSETARAVNRARAEGRRIIAVGTTVTRALESSADVDGQIHTGEGVATLKMGSDYHRRVVNGILTGFHDEGASHIQLLSSFLAAGSLASAYRDAEERGYLAHEYGDSCLILGA